MYKSFLLQDVIQFESTDRVDSSESLSPGNFSQIHLRLWDTWAQISLTSTKTRLRGSLNPDIIEEITHALGYIASVSRCLFDGPYLFSVA